LFGSIGFPELVVIFIVALLVLGPQRLPEMARTLGRTLRELRRTASDLQSSFNLEEEFETEPRAGQAPVSEKDAAKDREGAEGPGAPGPAEAEAKAPGAAGESPKNGEGAAPAERAEPPEGSRPA